MYRRDFAAVVALPFLPTNFEPDTISDIRKNSLNELVEKIDNSLQDGIKNLEIKHELKFTEKYPNLYYHEHHSEKFGRLHGFYLRWNFTKVLYDEAIHFLKKVNKEEVKYVANKLRQKYNVHNV